MAKNKLVVHMHLTLRLYLIISFTLATQARTQVDHIAVSYSWGGCVQDLYKL